MNITVYQDIDQFLAEVQPYLEQAEVANNIILGVALGLQDKTRTYDAEPLLLTMHDQESLHLVALMTPPHNLLLSTRHPMPDPFLDKLAQYLATTDWSVSGVMAQPGVVDSFATRYAAAKAVQFELNMEQRVYQLSQVTAPAAVAGSARQANGDDLDLVTGWVAQFSREALGEDGQQDSRALAERLVQDQRLYLWEDELPVSMAAKTRATRHVHCISLVYTPPEFRRCGYASACVAHVSQIILNEGYQYSCLFTDLANPTSNAIYQQIGYEPVRDFTIYKFR